MRIFPLVILLACFIGCDQKDKTSTTSNSDSTKISTTDTAKERAATEVTLMDLSSKILYCLKNKDFNCLAMYAHPTTPLRFSPYAFIDTASDKSFTKEQLQVLATDDKKINWGAYSAGEEEIIMSPKQYLEKFAYDVDFLNAPEKTVNKVTTRGTMPNTVKDIYSSHNFTEFYFPGFEKKYEGMDWRAIRLVFKQENGQHYLVAIIHDQWTT